MVPNPSGIAMREEPQGREQRPLGKNLMQLLAVNHRDDFLKEIERLLPKGDFYYLAGPMTNRPGFNFKSFDTVATTLRGEGLTIASPAEFDHEQVRAKLMESADGNDVDGAWGGALARDLVIVCHPRCTGVICIPEWWTSKGAQLETLVASKVGKPIFEYKPPHIIQIDRDKELSNYNAG